MSTELPQQEGKCRAVVLPVRATKQIGKPQNTSTKCPQRLPCPLLLQDTCRNGEDKTARENTVMILLKDGATKPFLCFSQTIPGNPSPFPAPFSILLETSLGAQGL